MRWQSTNESTAVFDLNYVKRGLGYDDDNVTEDGLMAFGKLMNAYDKSDGGPGVLEGAWDYFSAFAASPSTAATVGTFGFGVGSKDPGKGCIKSNTDEHQEICSENARVRYCKANNQRGC